MADFGMRLLQLRKERNIAQKRFAEELGVSNSSINMYEHGVREPNLDMLQKIANYFDVDVDYILGNSDIPKKSDISDCISKYDNLTDITTKKIPLIGEIACGKPSFADENFEEYITVDSSLNVDYALRCKGDSMIGARIMDGDLVFIRKQSTVVNGEIAAVIIDDSATLKRAYIYPDKLVLNAENPKYEPLIYVNEELEQVHILGKAISFQSKIK
jgi:repressor LexA